MAPNTFEYDLSVENWKGCNTEFQDTLAEVTENCQSYVNVKDFSEYAFVDIYSEDTETVHTDQYSIKRGNKDLVTLGCGPCTGFLGVNASSGQYFIGHSHPDSKRKGKQYWGEDRLARELVEEVETEGWEVEVFTGDAESQVQGVPDVICTVATFEHYLEPDGIKISALEEPQKSLGGNRRRRDASRAVGRINGELQAALLEKDRNKRLV